VWKWHKHYDPALDAEHKAIQQSATALQKAKQAEFAIAKDIDMAKPGSTPSSPLGDSLPRKDRGSAAHV
jgi:hypothetical protein